LIRSLCPEALRKYLNLIEYNIIVFWEEAQQFKQLESDIEKEQLLRVLYEKYLKNDALVELNLPDKRKTVAPVMAIADAFRENGTTIPSDVLKVLIDHCRTDLLDPFVRFERSDMYKIMLKQEMNNTELMVKIGLEQTIEITTNN
jgi:hypothetical protein